VQYNHAQRISSFNLSHGASPLMGSAEGCITHIVGGAVPQFAAGQPCWYLGQGVTPVHALIDQLAQYFRQFQ
jgi:hypothetical protein